MIRYFSIVLAVTALVMGVNAFGDTTENDDEPATLPYAITADEVLKQIAKRGPYPVLWEIFDRDAQWDQVVREIASGDPKWLKVAARFLTASDAAASEDLRDALNDAIEKSPEIVLQMGFCGEPLYDPAVTPIEEVMEGINRKIKAISNVKRCDLIKRRDECMRSLRKSIQEIREDYDAKNKK
jgi:hypothetical protein